MIKYEDEMYKFVTSSENFEAVCDLTDQFQIVKQRLRQDFWKEVKTSLQPEIERFNGWKIWMHDELNSNSALILYRDEFCYDKVDDAKATIRMDNLMDVPAFGLWINREWEGFDINDIWLKSKPFQSPSFKVGNINGWWWPLYNTLPYNFTLTKDIKKITPGNREWVVKEVVAVLVKCMDELTGFMESYFIRK